VVNRTPLSAAHVQKKFGFKNSLTDAEALFGQRDPNAILIATRHHLHAGLAQRALESGREVFVEKPLCLKREELEELWQTAHDPRVPGRVMVGFNRRFAPASVWLKERLASRPGPLAIAYHVNAGAVAPDHWYANLDESGGRFLGEGCHFFDWFCFLTGSRPVRVFAQALGGPAGKVPAVDSFSAQVEFEDGSSAQLLYTANAALRFPKETITVFGPDCAARLENFQRLEWVEGSKTTTRKFGSKGHAEEMAAWGNYLGGIADFPLVERESWRSMELTFAAMESLRAAASLPLPPRPWS
jgi:predicted dehydrogenase